MNPKEFQIIYEVLWRAVVTKEFDDDPPKNLRKKFGDLVFYSSRVDQEPIGPYLLQNPIPSTAKGRYLYKKYRESFTVTDIKVDPIVLYNILIYLGYSDSKLNKEEPSIARRVETLLSRFRLKNNAALHNPQSDIPIESTSFLEGLDPKPSLEELKLKLEKEVNVPRCFRLLSAFYNSERALKFESVFYSLWLQTTKYRKLLTANSSKTTNFLRRKVEELNEGWWSIYELQNEVIVKRTFQFSDVLGKNFLISKNGFSCIIQMKYFDRRQGITKFTYDLFNRLGYFETTEYQNNKFYRYSLTLVYLGNALVPDCYNGHTIGRKLRDGEIIIRHSVFAKSPINPNQSVPLIEILPIDSESIPHNTKELFHAGETVAHEHRPFSHLHHSIAIMNDYEMLKRL